MKALRDCSLSTRQIADRLNIAASTVYNIEAQARNKVLSDLNGDLLLLRRTLKVLEELIVKRGFGIEVTLSIRA